jgi:hypothetical protein
MNSADHSRNRIIVDALNAARDQLANSEIGWDSLQDDEDFVTAVDLVLQEISIQFEARGIPNANEVKTLRDGVREYIATNLASAGAESAAARPCTCSHAASMHVSYGCSWEDSTGGEPNICQCVHGAAFTSAQHRPYLVAEIARKSADKPPAANTF